MPGIKDKGGVSSAGASSEMGEATAVMLAERGAKQNSQIALSACPS